MSDNTENGLDETDASGRPLFRSAGSRVGSVSRGIAGKVSDGASTAASRARNVVDTASERIDSLGTGAPSTTASSTASTPASTAAVAAPVGVGAAAATASRPAAAASARTIRRTRKARLRLSRIDPWSVMKTTLLFSIAFAVIQFVAVWVIWGVIEASGAFDAVNRVVGNLVSSPTSPTFELQSYVNTNRVLGATAALGFLDVLLVTALATLFSFLYNLAATVLGGLEVTLAED